MANPFVIFPGQLRREIRIDSEVTIGPPPWEIKEEDTSTLTTLTSSTSGNKNEEAVDKDKKDN